MKQLKAQLQNVSSAFGAKTRNACIGAAGLLAGNSAFAAVDVAGAVSAVESAETQGGTVGTAVIVAVASLVVIGVVIAIVKKI